MSLQQTTTAKAPVRACDFYLDGRPLDKSAVADRAIRALAFTDQMSPGLRECVHEYGFAIVEACRQAKVTDPRLVHQLVREIWEGARQPAQRRDQLGVLDWLLVQAGCPLTAATLLRVLDNAGLFVVKKQATAPMIAASMREIANFNETVTKAEKHRRRLNVALKAGAAHIRPQLRKPATGVLVTGERNGVE